MLISFNIEYRTNWGEEVRILGDIPELGNQNAEKAIALHTIDGINWSVDIHLKKSSQITAINYYYLIWQNGKEIRCEWNSFQRRIYLSKDEQKYYHIIDNWKNPPEQLYFYSSAFTEAFLAHQERDEASKNYKKGILLKAYAPTIDKDYCLAICGNQKILGNWDPNKALSMSDINFPEWQLEIDFTQLTFPLEYKFVLQNKKDKSIIAWEDNPNRYMPYPEMKSNETLVISDRYVYFNLPDWKGAGVAIPVFSLKSEESFGVGDFSDLKRIVDWAVITHQKVVQILPINDTTITHKWTDSYPYNSISIYAFHPMYADLKKIGILKDKDLMAKFNKRQKELNTLEVLDYEAVNEVKWEYFKLIFAQEGKKTLASKDYKNFFESNKEWLEPYAVFSHLRDLYKTPNFRLWPTNNIYSAKEIDKICQPSSADYSHISIYFYIQYHLHIQLLEASSYARQYGIALKGDIPIGISRNSVEAWTEPYYFNLNGQAGAPPDDFSANGQNWGFPTYNWEVMAKDGYSWWMKRFRKMAEYFEAYRIDHILGFFRIWEIPMDSVHGLLGQFVPALPMSKEEIESYGIIFRKEFLEPYIHEYFLGDIFGLHTDYIKNTFIESNGNWERYRMRSEFNTQRKVEAFFEGKNDPDSIWIRDGLYALISNVLFVRDRNNPEMYHPRIGVQLDYIYRALNDNEKAGFNRLYDQYYYHRHNDFWQQQAMQKLPQLTQSTRMLVCGEDLGMIPKCVEWVMNDLRILSLEIQRMPKNPAYEFGHLNEYPYPSVCTFSTHDMSTLRGWWEENQEQTQHYYNNMLGHYGAAPTIATPEICEEIIKNQLYSQSILCILSLQDWTSIDEKWRNPNVEKERINIPANPKHYWRYRMHLSIEELMKADSLNKKIKILVKQTGRA